jgi:hypothetical protein
VSAVRRILGVDERDGAIELLGLSPEECTHARVEAALERQLDRVDAHPEAHTPEADEARLALHAAAAQLLDPAVRAALIREARERRRAAQDASPIEPAPSGARRHDPALNRADPAAGAAAEPRRPPFVAASGRSAQSASPDRVVKRVVIGGAVFVVLSILGLVGALIALTPTRIAPAPGGATPTTSSPAAGSSGAAASASPAEAGNTPEPGNVDGGTTPSASATGSVAASPAAPAQNPGGNRVRTPYADPAGVVRELRAAAETARRDPGAALAPFESAFAQAADWWAMYDRPTRRAVVDAVVEFFYACGQAGAPVAERAAQTIAAMTRLDDAARGRSAVEPDRVWPAVFAAGMLTRLSGEAELPRSVEAQVRLGLSDALGHGRTLGARTYEAGAAASLRLIPARLIAPAARGDEADQSRVLEGFDRWAQAVVAGTTDPSEVEGVLLEGLERVLVEGPEPDASPAALGAVELIASRLRWRAEGQGRRRLLAWFNDPRVSTADLRALTGALAAKSGAEGVEPTMVLSIGGSADDRAQLRARYAEAWGLSRLEERAGVAEAWTSAAAGAVGEPASKVPSDLAVDLAVQVRLNLAARRLWLGDAEEAGAILAALPRVRDALLTGAPGSAPLTVPTGGPPSPSPSGQSNTATFILTGADGDWAGAYLRAEQNIPVRLDRLAALGAMSRPIGRRDASVLAEAACFASPSHVRAAAQLQAARFADDPEMVRAMLDNLPLAPRVASVSGLFERVAGASLPPRGDGEWELAARRALVERLLTMLAVEGEQRAINGAAAGVADAYTTMSLSPAGPPDESDAERAVRGAGAMYSIWRAEAERLAIPRGLGVSLEQIQRRRESRDRTASGPAQAFAAVQLAAAEAFAYVVAAERPAEVGAVSGVLNELNTTRREAKHVLEQMLLAERAITRLWAIRLKEGGA